MKSFFGIQKVVFFGLLAVAGLGASAGGVQAGHYDPCYRYKWTICYETKCIPCTTVVTCYDHCGRPYYVNKTYYKHVRVPVKKLVKVCY